MMALPSDELLMVAFSRGDRESFERLVAVYAPALDAFFRRRLPDDGRAEELRQETLLALYALAPSYVERGRLRSLVFTIAYRQLVSARRAERPAEAIPIGLAARQKDPDLFRLRDAVASLPEGLREALLLTRLDGLTAAEAGEVLDCSPEAVRARACRARSALARKLRPEPRRTK